MNRAALMAACLTLACISSDAQEVSSGLFVPLTVSGNALYTHGYAGDDYQGNSATVGFRGVIAPSLRLGKHWFVYSALESHSSSFFRYKSGPDNNQEVYFHVMQGFLGYTTRIGKTTVLVKAGQLSSAFGSYPLEYDDAKTPFPSPPPGYVTTMPLRPDQLPCGVRDLLGQSYGSDISFSCGGSQTAAYGNLPVTLYGLPGIEGEVSTGRMDARLQLTNSSPANPQSLLSRNQVAQWIAGAGYTLVAGLRVGVSGFRGPYLDKAVDAFLPPGKSIRSFPASAVGADAQWARGRWSAEGEWQEFRFNLPEFVTSPAERSVYAQLKTILSPRIYLAVRASSLSSGHVRDTSGTTVNLFTSPEQLYEFALGYRPNRYQLLKIGYEWTNRQAWSTNGTYWPQERINGVEVQLVTTVTAFSHALR